MSEIKFQPKEDEFPKLSEKEEKEEKLIVTHGAWEFHYSYGYPLLVLPR